MPSRSIIDRLKAGEILVKDGGTGSEVQRRGYSVSQGASRSSNRKWGPTFGKGWNGDAEGINDPLDDWAGLLGPWSTPANLNAPGLVRKLHEDYLKAGADIVTSNTFYSGRTSMAKIGEGDRWEEYTRRGVEIAIKARNAVKPEAYVAGGFGPSAYITNKREFREEVGELARVLADAGSDFLLPEYFGGDTDRDPMEDCQIVLDVCAETNLPVFLGINWVQNNGKMHKGQTFSDLVKIFKGRRVDGVFLMCSSPPAISACLPNLRKAFDGPIGAYAQAGYKENPKFGTSPDEEFFIIDQDCYPPKKYAEYASEWMKMGAQVIGGCCATGPDHIEAIASIVKGNR